MLVGKCYYFDIFSLKSLFYLLFSVVFLLSSVVFMFVEIDLLAK